ncbi:MAG: leucine-rich repeat domain-containing protein [Clostridia bacterium]|nr:leucine-rich repeat domain-containing protein [Clostridia bacterium]
MNYCPKCRKKLIVEDFCVECGADLTEYVKKSSENVNTNNLSFGGFAGFNFSAFESEAQKQLNEQQRLDRIAADFVINNGILKKYTGKGGAIVIPKEVSTIDENVFLDNSTVTEVTFEEGVKKVDTFAFKNTSALKKVTFPSSLESLGYGVFMNSSVEEVYFQNGLRELSTATFYYANKLKKVDLPDSLERINENAFCATERLLALFIPRSVSTIEQRAFCGSALTALYFEAGFLPFSIPTGDFDQYDNWKNQCYAAEYYSCVKERVKIPDYDTEAKAYGVSMEHYSEADYEIHNNRAFYCQRPASYVRIPYGISRVCRRSFEKNPDAVSITLPRTTTVIESNFMAGYWGNNNTTLRSVYAENVTKIGSDAFRDCVSLTTFQNTDKVEVIEFSAFSGCTSLVDFKFPTGLKKLGAYAFHSVPAFKDLKFPASLGTVPSSAFCECPNLESVEICSGITAIDTHAFGQCTKLKRVVLPSTLTEIKKYAFVKCSSLVSIEIPEGVLSIEEAAFGECTSLRSVKIPYSVTGMETDSMDRSFRGCTGLRFVYLPAGRTEAFKRAFPSPYDNPNITFIEY